MTNIIHVYSREKFIDMIEKRNINDATVNSFNEAFISIISPIDTPIFNNTHINVLTLRFNDLTDKEYNTLKKKYSKSEYMNDVILFNKDMALSVLEFFYVNQHVDKWHIHCLAGVSRSSAIGLWLCNILNIPPKTFLKKHPHIDPNKYVLNLLREVSKL